MLTFLIILFLEDKVKTFWGTFFKKFPKVPSKTLEMDRTMIVMRRIMFMVLLIILIFLMSSCVIVPHDAEGGVAAVAGSAVLQATDVDSYLADYWQSVMVPEIYERRVDLVTLVTEAQASGWEGVGAIYGEIRGEIGASYNFLVHGTAIVAETNTESRNGFIVLNFDGVEGYEVRISIGPAFSGSAIRDSIRFIDFAHFVNQVDFARLATELNRFTNSNLDVDLFALEGEVIEFTGAFEEPSGENVINIMPIFLEVR